MRMMLRDEAEMKVRVENEEVMTSFVLFIFSVNS